MGNKLYGEETWFSQYYAKPGDYLRGEFNTIRPELNEADPSHCPHCNSNHSMWAMRDGDDLYCWQCGWRDSFYFNKRLNEFLKMNLPQFWIEEEASEALTLAQRIIENKLARKKRHYAKHRQELLAKSKAYNEIHKDEIRTYKTLWARENRRKQRQSVMV